MTKIRFFANVSKDLWIELFVDFLYGYPIGLDDSPTIDGFGNMITQHGSWVSMKSEFGCYGNWNIAGMVETPRNSVRP